MKLNLYLVPHTKKSTQSDLTYNPETVKLLEDIGEKLHENNIDSDFMNRTQNARAAKIKVNK